MATVAVKLHVSYAEYLAFERAALTKHEFLEGAVYAMAGGTIEHSLLATNLAAALVVALRDRPCIVLNSDARVRVHVPRIDLATYPDVSVVCGPIVRATDDPDAVTNPIVLVEVLSEGTEAYDRGRKFARYRRIASLREYVLVAQAERRVEVYQRTEPDQAWTLHEYGPTERVALHALGITVAVDDVYRNVTVPAEPG